MPIAHVGKRCSNGLCGLVLSCVTGALATHAASQVPSPDEAYLRATRGTWVTDGTVGGKPVRYLAEGQIGPQVRGGRLHRL